MPTYEQQIVAAERRIEDLTRRKYDRDCKQLRAFYDTNPTVEADTVLCRRTHEKYLQLLDEVDETLAEYEKEQAKALQAARDAGCPQHLVYRIKLSTEV